MTYILYLIMCVFFGWMVKYCEFKYKVTINQMLIIDFLSAILVLIISIILCHYHII